MAKVSRKQVKKFHEMVADWIGGLDKNDVGVPCIHTPDGPLSIKPEPGYRNGYKVGLRLDEKGIANDWTQSDGTADEAYDNFRDFVDQFHELEAEA